MIAIVDYGIGNLGSVTKAFRHLGAETVLSGDPAVLGRADLTAGRLAGAILVGLGIAAGLTSRHNA